MSEPLAQETLVSKGEFAKLINVTPGRVSQYITEGKLTADAFDGSGRSAKVRVEQACRQLKLRLDISQRLGNGITTRLEPQVPLMAMPAAQPARVFEPREPEEDVSVEAQLKREKLREAQYRNRKAAEEEEARKGRLTETVAARAQMASVAAGMLQVFEGSLADIASAVAAKFSVPQRDVLHLLRAEFRNLRDRASEQTRRRQEEMPETLSTRIEAES
ncbi:hypothetical protein [Breoghania sp. L-A4]|uniref:hypothetical protein n=1 Tax=Breoghania sp. L-A4 TaxID=2304600 RepID=UPI000E360CB6|nr:hypothetical protein [Breoghania sp. L-A4]AXS39255.1 hypothetical protein D1F64_03315 [Breoghania sp. L-A4]